MFQHKRIYTQGNTAVLMLLLLLASLLIPSSLLAATLPAPSLTAAVQAGPQVKLTWVQPKASISGFEIQRSLDPASGYAKILAVGRTILTTTDTKVQAGTGYYYRVRCYKTGTTTSYSAFSNVAFADVPPAVVVDSTPPTVSIISPSAGAQYATAQTVSITASAQDNVGVSKVEFYDGGVLKKTATVAPYKHDWPVTAADNGSHSFVAKAYDPAGNLSSSSAVGVSVNIPVVVAAYTAPVLESVKASGTDMVLTWSLPQTSYGTPAGGYDIFSDGVDDNLHHTTLSAVKSGLQQGVEHCFVVESRWTQAVPSVFPASNQVCVLLPDVTKPSVTITSPAAGTAVTTAQTLTVAATAQDNIGISKVEFYDGAVLKATDTVAPYSFDWAVTDASNGTHSLAAKAYDAAGNVTGSTAVSVSVNIPVVVAVYTAPVLESVKASGTDMVLTWSLPPTSYGTPAGGYDIFSDGVDDNLHHTTLTAVKSGLQQGVEHCFVVESRWTQAVPSVFPASNQVCALLPLPLDITKPSVAIASPVSGTAVTTAQTLTVAATAQDNIGVSKVEFYDGAVLEATDTVAPYSFAWAVTDASNGTHIITAKAYDAAGNVTSSTAVSVSVNIQTTPVPPTISGPVKVFPGAQGFGADTKAGRGGQIIKVTNLNDSGAGSFRAAAQASGPRIIVFEVGGEIKLLSQLWIRNPYITIAGQTAPAPGVVFSGSGLRIPTHDVLIQHVFVRHTASDATDAIDIRADGAAIPYNIVVDHVSVSWGDDENLSFNPGASNTINNNVTYSNNLIAECNGSQYGTLLADGTKNLTVVGNLWMSHKERQPRVKGKVSANIVSNLSYNVGSGGFSVVGAATGVNSLSYAGNIFLPGPSTPSSAYAIGATADIVSGTKVYLSDNVMSGSMTNSAMNAYLVNSPPVTLGNVTVVPSHLVEEHVLANAGARPGERDGTISNGIGDPVDERLVSEVRMGKGSLKTSPPDMPVLKPSSRPFSVPANPNGDDNGNGYTNIEEILYQMALAVE